MIAVFIIGLGIVLWAILSIVGYRVKSGTEYGVVVFGLVMTVLFTALITLENVE